MVYIQNTYKKQDKLKIKKKAKTESKEQTADKLQNQTAGITTSHTMSRVMGSNHQRKCSRLIYRQQTPYHT